MNPHNEVVLMCGSLGFSTLICLLNNGNNGQTETTANMLGRPFWRLDSPRNGKRRLDHCGHPRQGPRCLRPVRYGMTRARSTSSAEVDVWHSSTEGFTKTRIRPGRT